MRVRCIQPGSPAAPFLAMGSRPSGPPGQGRASPSERAIEAVCLTARSSEPGNALAAPRCASFLLFFLLFSLFLYLFLLNKYCQIFINFYN
jgi:hypothetical protein